MAKKIFQWLMVLVAFMVLTACGGGGGNSVDKNNTQHNTPQVTQNKKTITGYVIDDPVVGATIEVYDANRTLLTKEENATDSSGKFSIKGLKNSNYYMVKVFYQNKELYNLKVSNHKTKKNIILSPLTILNVDLNSSNPEKYLEAVSYLKTVIGAKGISPLKLNKLINSSNHKFLKEKLSQFKFKKYNAKCFYKIGNFPKKVACFSSYPTGYKAIWSIDDKNISLENTTFDLNESKNIKLSIYNDSDKRVYNKLILVTGSSTIYKKEITLNPSMSDKKILIGKYVINIPQGAFKKDTTLEVANAKGVLSKHYTPVSNNIITISPSNTEISHKPIKIEIPLNDFAIKLAQNGMLKFLKKDKNGEMLLNPQVDYDKKIATVEIISFSMLQPIESTGGSATDFVDALKIKSTNKNFYDVLYNLSDDNMKNILNDIKEDKININNILERKVGDSRESIASSLIKLYNQLQYMSVYFEDNQPNYTQLLKDTYKFASEPQNDLDPKVLQTISNALANAESGEINIGGMNIELSKIDFPGLISFGTQYTKTFDKYFGRVKIVSDILDIYKDPIKFTISKLWEKTFFSEAGSFYTMVAGVYIESEFKALNNASDEIEKIGGKLDNSYIESILVDSGEMGSSTIEWWKTVKENAKKYNLKISNNQIIFGKKTDTGLLSFGSKDYGYNQRDFFNFYNYWKNNSPQEIINKKEFIKNSIKILLSILENGIKKDSEDKYFIKINNHIDTDSEANYNSNVVADDSTLLVFKPKNGFLCKNIHLTIYDEQDKKYIIDKTYPPMSSDDNITVFGRDLNYDYNIRHTFRIKISGDLYDNGTFSTTKLYPFVLNRKADIKKIPQYKYVSEKDFITNSYSELYINEVDINSSGTVSFTMANNANLNQYLYFTMENGVIVLYDKDKNIIYSAPFSTSHYDDRGTNVVLHKLSSNALSAVKKGDTIYASMRADFIMRDEKYEHIKKIPYNYNLSLFNKVNKISNEFINSKYRYKVQIKPVIDEKKDIINGVSLKKVVAFTDENITGILSILDDKKELFKSKVDVSNQWLSINLSKKILKSGKITFTFIPKGKDKSFASSEFIPYILYSEKKTDIKIDGYSVKKDDIGRAVSIDLKFKILTANFIKDNNKYKLIYNFDNGNNHTILVNGKDLKQDGSDYSYEIPIYDKFSYKTLSFKIVLANDNESYKTRFEKVTLVNANSNAMNLMSLKNGYSINLASPNSFNTVFNFSINNSDTSKKLCSNKLILNDIVFSILPPYKQNSNFILDKECKTITVKQKMSFGDLEYGERYSDIVFNFKNINGEKTTYVYKGLNVLKYLNDSKTIKCVSNVKITFSKYNVVHILFDIYNDDSCRNITIDFGDGSVKSYSTNIGKTNNIVHSYPEKSSNYNLILKIGTANIEKHISINRKYVISGDLAKLVLSGKVKDYPYGDISKLLKLDENSDYDHDELSNSTEFYANESKSSLMEKLKNHNYSFNGWYKGLNPFSKDTDKDGFSDYEELHHYITYKGEQYTVDGLDPLKNNLNDDFDGDGLSNKLELSIGSNVAREDTDGNGLSDKEEYELSLKYKGKLHISVSNDSDDLFIDSDKDKILNICELEGDGQYWSSHLNKSANCKQYQNYVTNPFKKDTDGDTLPDWYEKIAYLPLPHLIPLNPNIDMQKNKFNPTVDDAYKDYDKDGLPNIIEYKHGYYPLSFNSVMNAETKIADGFVYKYGLESSLASDDNDSDGFSIEEEYLNDTDPLISYAKLQKIGKLPFKAHSLGAKYKYLNNKIVLADFGGHPEELKVYMYDIKQLKAYTIDTNVFAFGENEMNRYKISNVYENNNSIFVYLQGKYSNKIAQVAYNDGNYTFKGVSKAIGEKVNSVDRKNLVAFDINDSKEYIVPEDNFVNKIESIHDDFIIVNTLKKKTPLFKISKDSPYNPYKFLSNNILLDVDNQTLFKLSYTLNKDKTPYYILNKFWQEDANHNGIKDKYEYNNTRYEYVNVKDVLKLDSDSDGVTDIDEMNKYHTNPLLKDSDGDGLSDFDEITKYKTNPHLIDTDGDGLSDSYEISHKKQKRLVVVDLSLYHLTSTMDNKKIPLVDSSFISNVKDFAEGKVSTPQGYFESLFTWSKDNKGNIIAKFKQDGKVYHFKYKETATDPLKYDSDGDGIGDGYEIAYHLDPTDAKDASYSPAKMIIDGKTIENHNTGYRKEVKYLISPLNPKTNLENFKERKSTLISTYNPYSSDYDKDGLSDAAEYYWKLDPTNPNDANKDSDNDGLSNKEEILYDRDYSRGLDPHKSDTDGDGLPDGWEVTHKSNPSVANANEKVKGKDYTYSELYNGKVTILATKTNGIVPPVLNTTFTISVIGATPPYKYTIGFGDDSDFETGEWENEGTYTVKHSYNHVSSGAWIRIVDKNGKEFQNSIDLNISKNNAPEIDSFVADKNNGYSPLKVIFNYSVQDKEHDTYSCYFTIDAIKINDSIDNSCTVGKFEYTFDKVGIFNVTLHAKDQYDNETNKTINIVTNKKLIKLTADHLSGYAPQDITFNLEGVDINKINSIDWNFGDGNSINNKNVSVSHNFTDIGNFVVKVKINYLDNSVYTLEQEVSIYGNDISINTKNIDFPNFEKHQGDKISFNGYQYNLEDGGLVIKNNNSIVGTLKYSDYKTPVSSELLSSSNDRYLYINPEHPNTLYALSDKAIKVIDIHDRTQPELKSGIVLTNDNPNSYYLSARFFKNELVIVRKGSEGEENMDIDSLYFNLPSITDNWKDIDVNNKKAYILESNNAEFAQIDFVSKDIGVVGILYNKYDENGNRVFKSKLCKIVNKQITSVCTPYRKGRFVTLRASNGYIFMVYKKFIDVYDTDLNFKYTIGKKGSSQYYMDYYDVIANNSVLKVFNKDCHDIPCKEGISDYFKINPNYYNKIIPTDSTKGIVIDKNLMLKSDGAVKGIKLIDNYLLLAGSVLKDYSYKDQGGGTITSKRLYGPVFEKYDLDDNISNIIVSGNDRIDHYTFNKPTLVKDNKDIYFNYSIGERTYLEKLMIDKNATKILSEEFYSEEAPELSYDKDNRYIYIFLPYESKLKQYNITNNTIKSIKVTDDDYQKNHSYYVAYRKNIPYIYNKYALIAYDSSIYVYDKNEYAKIDKNIKEKKIYNDISGNTIKFINNDFIATDKGIGFVDNFENMDNQDILNFIEFNKNFRELKIVSNYIFGLTDNEFIIYKINLTDKTINEIYSINIPNYVGEKVFEVDRKNKKIFIGGNGYLIKMDYNF